MEEFLEAVELGTKNHCAGEGQQQFSGQSDLIAGRKSEVGVGGYQSTVLCCIARHRYQATTSEDSEDVTLAVVICRVCILANVLQ
jgi:hypothetical protein